MRAIALIKSILDPEAPPGAIRFAGSVASGDVTHVLGPFEGNALELAVQLAEAGEGSFAAIAAGGPEQDVALRKALALGAQTALRIDLEPGFHSPMQLAQRLWEAAQGMGPADVYLFGRQAGDWDLGVTAGLFAGVAGLPYIPLVREVRPEAGGVFVRREIPGGEEELKIAGACVLSATNGPKALLRLPKVKDVMLANRKPIARREPSEFRAGARIADIRPLTQGRAGRRIGGDLAAQARALAEEIRRHVAKGGDR